MKVLWLTGIVIPQATEIIGLKKTPFGGWVSQMVDELSATDGFKIGVAMKSNVSNLIIKEHENVTYYFLPTVNRFDISSADAVATLAHFKPDLVHAEGCEQKYTNTFLKQWSGKNIVSLQGIISGYEPYEFGGLNPYNLMFSFNLKNCIFGILTILNKKFVFNKRLQIEKDTIELAHNLTGRTLWDRANSYFFNPEAPYFHCPRILRPSFYRTPRQKSKLIKHSIFIGNSAQARKGAHFVLEAVALLKKEYPDVKLYIAGQEHKQSLTDWKSYFGYRAYLKRKIKKLSLSNHIEFLGVLSEEQMAAKLAQMQVYVMSSVIENSPNTLGEAMILGVPCVSSFNGGIADMAENEREALYYRDNDPRMLAYQIKRIFDDENLAKTLSENAVKKAKKTHSRTNNLQLLINAYNTIGQ